MAIFDLSLSPKNAKKEQERVLVKLLRKAKNTAFGKAYNFDQILMSNEPAVAFKKNVPLFNYNKIYKEWWVKSLEGETDVCWPGKIQYYALSSGTSEAASKYIPVTKELLAGNKAIMVKQLLTLLHYKNVPHSSIAKGWLTIGGSTDLQKGDGYYAGDLSGITAKKAPIWFRPFYKPGKKIAKERDWHKKLEEIVEKAPSWDIGFVVGVPAWVQMCFEMIIERYKLNNIHDLWPNLSFYGHGGMSFEPYKIGFERLLGKPLTYIETYLASEGFLAYQDHQNATGMRLVTDEHIYFEFVPFNEKNFDDLGELKENAVIYSIDEIEEGIDYAILITTTGGAWRYLIGDTIKFIDKENTQIIITGRTKHFLSLVGEHLSVDNMNKAIDAVSAEFNISIPEYTVTGVPYGSFFAHKWYIACNDSIDPVVLAKAIDQKLCSLNDDYAIERNSALKDISVQILKEEVIRGFMEFQGKLGGQHKFPRVLKGKQLEAFETFLQNNQSPC
jgi:hypothetical protein